MVNSPLPSDLATECRKAAKTLKSFIDPGTGVDQFIPPTILARAKGLAILTVIKAGFLFSGRGGSGLVVARLPDGSWSAPSAIGTGGIGFGGQIGAEMTDFVILLNTEDAVKAFAMGGNVTLGGNLSVSAGPLGRTAEAGAALGKLAPVYSYSKSKGLFAGVSIEGSMIIERTDANEKFYRRRVTARELLSGDVERPAEAAPLYQELEIKANRARIEQALTEEEHRPGRRYSQSQTAPPTIAPKPRPVSTLAGSAAAGAASGFGHRHPPPPPPRPRPTASAVLGEALYDFDAVQAGDIPFRRGDVIEITQQTASTNDWWKGRVQGGNGQEGSFPANYVRLL